MPRRKVALLVALVSTVALAMSACTNPTGPSSQNQAPPAMDGVGTWRHWMSRAQAAIERMLRLHQGVTRTILVTPWCWHLTFRTYGLQHV